MCSFRQSRRFFDALCLCAFHSPQPRIFSPVESTIKSIGPSWDRVRGGTATIWFRRESGGVVRGLEVEAHQAEQRVQEPLGLAERQAEDDPQRQRGPDREVRVPPLASAKTVLRWYPRGNCILAQPDRDVAAAPEATLVLPPVPDSVLLLVLAVDSARLRCDHDVTPPDLYDGLDPTPAASVLAYTDSCTNAANGETLLSRLSHYRGPPQNKVAHPTATTTFPDPDQVLAGIDFLEMLSTVLVLFLRLHVGSFAKGRRGTSAGAVM